MRILSEPHCKRPCHDCPFRTDIPKYQSYLDVANNVRRAIEPYGIAHCHNTTPDVCDHVQKTVKRHVCAGFLQFVQNIHALKWYDIPDINFAPIYASLEEFIRDAPAPDQSMEARGKAWCDAQPRHRREYYYTLYGIEAKEELPA